MVTIISSEQLVDESIVNLAPCLQQSDLKEDLTPQFERKNLIPEFFTNPNWEELSSLSPAEYRDYVVEKESEIRLPSLLSPERVKGLETPELPNGIDYKRNGYHIVGYRVPVDHDSSSAFTTEESIGIRAYLAAQYLHPELSFFDSQVAQNSRFLMETDDFFRPGDIVLLVMQEDGQIVSHLGIEGPIEEGNISLGDIENRTSLHYVEEVYQETDGTPMIHSLVSRNKDANSLREIRRFSIRHNLELPEYIQQQVDVLRIQGESRGAKVLEKKMLIAERVVISLETVAGLTQAIPYLDKVEESMGEELVFIMDTNENIVRLAIKGLLGIIPKSGKVLPLIDTTGEPSFIYDPFISLDGLSQPYNRMLRPRYDPEGKGKDVALRLFTLGDVKRSLGRKIERGNTMTRQEEVNLLLAEYARTRQADLRLEVYDRIKESFRMPIASELVNPLTAKAGTIIKELRRIKH